MSGGAIPPGVKWLQELTVGDATSKGIGIFDGNIDGIANPVFQVFADSNVRLAGPQTGMAWTYDANRGVFNPVAVAVESQLVNKILDATGYQGRLVAGTHVDHRNMSQGMVQYKWRSA